MKSSENTSTIGVITVGSLLGTREVNNKIYGETTRNVKPPLFPSNTMGETKMYVKPQF